MSYRELTMIEVKEVLRRHESGQGLREIARATGLDRKTVRRYVQAAERVEGEATEEIVQEVAQEVQGRPLPAPSEPRKLLDAHRDCIAGWLAPSDRKKRPLRLTKVHELLKRRGVEVTYATLWRWAHDELGWRERTPTVRLDDPDPGHEAQVDFGKMGDVFDPITERVRALWCLVITLSFSRMQFAWPTFEQTTEAVCEGLDAAWAFFGGMPRNVLIDNAKAMITTAHATAPRVNDGFADYAQAREIFVDAARVRRPKDKARVENQVPFVRESWFIDDFALEPMTRDESRDVYQLFVERNGRLSTIITSNRDTSEWIATFDDVLLAQSAVDRLASNAYDVVVEGESYRSRLKPKITGDEKPPAVPIVKSELPIRRRKR